jgi:hypothetical protein
MRSAGAVALADRDTPGNRKIIDIVGDWLGNCAAPGAWTAEE